MVVQPDWTGSPSSPVGGHPGPGGRSSEHAVRSAGPVSPFSAPAASPASPPGGFPVVPSESDEAPPAPSADVTAWDDIISSPEPSRGRRPFRSRAGARPRRGSKSRSKDSAGTRPQDTGSTGSVTGNVTGNLGNAAQPDPAPAAPAAPPHVPAAPAAPAASAIPATHADSAASLPFATAAPESEPDAQPGPTAEAPYGRTPSVRTASGYEADDQIILPRRSRDLTPTVENIHSSWECNDERIVAPAPRRRTGAGWAGRISVLTVLGLVTVIAPISTRVSPSPLASAALNTQSETPAPEASAPASSVAAAVLGSDADVDSPSDSDLSNVPDAATRTRIREARENAVVTCSPQTGGASGDTSAFNKAPEIFFPMISDTYTVSSPYGYRLHPTLGYMKLHAGQDFAAPVGTPIYAAAAGKVVFAGMDDGAGTVTIEHQIDGQTWYTSYLHMYEDGIYVKVGDTVTAGQLIAGVGNTGRSSGSHLHFEVRTKNDTADESTVDPEKWLEDHHAAELSTDCT